MNKANSLQQLRNSTTNSADHQTPKMDKQLDIRFDRVERALSTLVDSIAKYNPSIPSAQDLVAADAELGKGLEERT